MKYSVILFALIIWTSSFHQIQAQDENPNKKFEEKYHEFDFWIGHWDVYTAKSDKPVAKSHIESIIDGVGILENYTSGQFKGKSLNKYNTVTDKWEQFWIDNGGLTLKLEGNKFGDKMIMSSHRFDKESEEYVIQRIVWTPNDDGTVSQVWKELTCEDEFTMMEICEGSDHGAVNVAVIFDGVYRRSSE